MQIQVLKLWEFVKENWAREEAQNLTEYALCFTVIAFGSVATMSDLASSIGQTFSAVSVTLSSSIT